MWEENVYEIGQRSYDELNVQANEAVSKTGLYAGILAGGVALTSAYYVNANSAAYNPEILQKKIADKKAKKLSKREQAVEEVIQRSNEEKTATQTESAKELAKHREEVRAKNREREEALNRRRAEREAKVGEWDESNVYHDPVSEEHVKETLKDRMPTQEEIDKARAEAASTRQSLDDAAEKLEAAKNETVGSRVDRRAKKDSVLKKALNTVKKTIKL